MMRYPRTLLCRLRFETQRVDDVPEAVRTELRRIDPGSRLVRGTPVAIAVGSRGIANLAAIVRTLVEALRALGVEPFVLPAMGSHGGATAEGQRRVLAGYGIHEDAVGAPVRASMGTLCVGTTADGVPVHVSRTASEAGGVLLVNRVKPHTSFAARIESGLVKMAMIGLGNHDGAVACHRAMLAHSFDRLVDTVWPMVRARLPIVAGLALVENASDETGAIEAILPDDFCTREPVLLERARRWMPRLPLDAIDVLVVDETGKDVSGLGMDPNVTGRKAIRTPGLPTVTRLIARDLTPASHGNAHGIGLADFTTTRLVRAIDARAMALNALAAGNPQAARIPLAFDTDREAIEAALATIGRARAEDVRLVRIRNTLRLDVVEVSEACLPDLAGRADVERLSAPREITFDRNGNLTPLPA
jgi:hypothetical protein